MSAMDRRSRRPCSLRGLALWSRRSTKPETFARLETRLLGPGGAPECRPRSDLLGNLRPDTGLSVGSDRPGHLVERLDREHGRHLRVARLVPLHARDRPQLSEQAGPVAVDGEVAAIEPLDAAVAAGDDREPLGVGADPEPIRFRECPELLDGPLLQR